MLPTRFAIITTFRVLFQRVAPFAEATRVRPFLTYIFCLSARIHNPLPGRVLQPVSCRLEDFRVKRGGSQCCHSSWSAGCCHSSRTRPHSTCCSNCHHGRSCHYCYVPYSYLLTDCIQPPTIRPISSTIFAQFPYLSTDKYLSSGFADRRR